jgi:GNAT superfamily N-acetyltransferase
MGPEGRRAAAFARWFDERTCTRIGPWRWGTAFVDAAFPDVPDSNYVSIDAVAADATPARVVSDVERVRAALGIRHRRVIVQDIALADRLAPAFEEAGWRIERYRLMVHRRVTARARPAPDAAEVSLVEFLRFRDALEAETQGTDEPLRAHHAYAEKIHGSVGTRCFLSWIGGCAVSGCVLWTHFEDAQLDSVATLPAFRVRGAAGAAIAAAVEAARTAGASWIHLYTLSETGPIGLYHRLGFDDVGSIAEFVGA